MFEPQSAINSDGSPLGPVIGKQLEAGVKGNRVDGRLLVSATIYRIRRSNRAVADPNDATASVGSGLVESKGFELEANGRLARNWTFNGGDVYNKNEVLGDTDPALVGTQFIAVIPEHSVKAFTNYEFDAGAPNGFSIGSDVTWNGESTGVNVTQDSYVVLGLRMGYDFSKHAGITLNVNNLLDEEYY